MTRTVSVGRFHFKIDRYKIDNNNNIALIPPISEDILYTKKKKNIIYKIRLSYTTLLFF